ncbi:hypothetical protein RIF29_05033 [Crotalaria pallida]|uniref:Uncharacterized protein n=1 Tax=Crotalaria pallida TaxID=3830 RepID=A0AAN9PAD5_CROPI
MASSSRIPIDQEEENHSSPSRERSRSPPAGIYHHPQTPEQIAEMEREENDVLRAQNERLLKENMLMKKILENAKCLACWGLSIEDVEKHKHSLEQLKLENAQLKDKAS